MTTTLATAQFIVSSKNLKKALSFVGGAILANPIVPALENVLIDIRDGVMRLTGSDLNTTLSTTIELLETDLLISFCTPYKTLSNLLSAIPEQPVTIAVNPETYITTVTTGSGTYSLAGENPVDYPRADVDDSSQHEISIDSAERASFVDKLARVVFAVSTNEMQPHLRGVCWWDTECCSTDGSKKLSRLQGAPLVGEHQYLIPANIINLLVKLSDSADPSEPLRISLNEKNILLTLGEQSIFGTLIDSTSKFPEYKQIIPTLWAKAWTVDRNSLLAALRRVMVLSTMPTDTVALAASSNTITLSVNDLDLNQSGRETISADINGELTIGFVGKTLLEALQNTAGDRLTIRLNAFNQAVLFTGEDENASVLLFPVKI